MNPKSETTILFPSQIASASGGQPGNAGSRPTPPPGTAYARRGRRRRADVSRFAMATVMGVVTWFVIDSMRMKDREVQVAVSVAAPTNWQLARPPVPATATVSLRGARGPMDAMQKALTLEAAVGALEESADAAEVDVPLRHARLAGVPEGVQVFRVQPETVKVQLARNDTQFLEVEVVTTGEPAAGYAVRRLSAEPARVAVSGPKAEVMKYAMASGKVQTEPVDLSGRRRTESRSVRLVPPVVESAAGMRTALSLPPTATSVFATVDLEEAPVTAEIAHVPVRLLVGARDVQNGLDGGPGGPGGAGEGWADPPEVTVTVTGQKTLVNTLTPDQLVVYATAQGMVPDPGNPGEYTVRLAAIPPKVASIVKIEPERVAWKPRPGGAAP